MTIVFNPHGHLSNGEIVIINTLIGVVSAQEELESGRMAESQHAQQVVNGEAAKRRITPIELLLKIVLVGTESHFENRGLLDETRMEHALQAGKQVLYQSHQESEV